MEERKVMTYCETPAVESLLCPEGSLEGKCVEFTYCSNNQTREGFLVCTKGRVYAYRNNCPHIGAPLNWVANQFLTEDKKHIVCALHGALFRIEDGLCIAGPCYGESLEALPIPPLGTGLNST